MPNSDKVNYKLVGERIQKRRKELGLSQMELSEKLDISNTYLSYIETGKKIPVMDIWLSICKELGVTSDYLLHGTVYSTTDSQLIESISLCTIEEKRMLGIIVDAFLESHNWNKE